MLIDPTTSAILQHSNWMNIMVLVTLKLALLFFIELTSKSISDNWNINIIDFVIFVVELVLAPFVIKFMDIFSQNLILVDNQ